MSKFSIINSIYQIQNQSMITTHWLSSKQMTHYCQKRVDILDIICNLFFKRDTTTMLTGLSAAVPDSLPPRDAQQPSPHTVQQASDQAVENAALAGAAAIRRVVGERNELRRERERLTAVNEELRDQILKLTTARDSYVQLSSDLLAQLKHIHHTIYSAVQKTQGLSLAPEDRDATLIDLARRFSPAASRLQRD